MDDYSAQSLNNLIITYQSEQSEQIDRSIFISKLLEFETQASDVFERFKICLALGSTYCLDGQNQNLSLAEKYLILAEKDFPSEIIKGNEREVYFSLGHLYARKNYKQESKAYFEKYIQSLLVNDVRLNVDSIYSFRKINKFTISDLVNNEITLSNPIIFNDPYDTLLFQFLDYRRRKIKEDSEYDISPMIEAYNAIRVRCFSGYNIKANQIVCPILNRLQWAHYADEFRGICILYEFSHSLEIDSSIRWYRVDYKKCECFGDKTKESIQLLLATKNKDWKYENEVRLIYYDPTITKEQHIQIPLEKLGGKIKAIIFGSRCSEKDEQTIRELFKSQDIFFKILGTDYLEKNDNVYDLRIDNEEKWKDLLPK